MSAWAWALLVFTAAANPARQAGRRATDGIGPGAAAATAGLVVTAAVLLAWFSDPVLDLLDVSVPSARIAVGLVAGVAGLRDVLTARPPSWEPLLVRPEVLLPALTIGADHGTPVVGAAAAGAVLLTVLLGRWRAGRPGTAAARLLGAALVVAGVDMVVDGILDV